MAVSSIITEGLGPAAAGVGGTNLQINSAVIAATSITITLSDPMFVAGPASVLANWTITPIGGAVGMSVTAISIASTIIVLTVTPGTIGGSYVLNIPVGIVRQADANPLIPPYTYGFTAVGTAPTLIQVVMSGDARSFDVVFSTAMTDEALLVSNYGITPTSLHVSSVAKVTDNRFTISTSEAQIPGQSYTITVSNAHDVYGNAV